MVSPRFGGGVERHLQDLCGHLANEMVCLVLQPLSNNHVALRLGSHPTVLSVAFRLPRGVSQLAELLAYIGVSSIHFHHAHDVSDSAWALPELVSVPYDVTLHDHYFINQNPYQSDENGRFCEELDRQVEPYPPTVPLVEWQRLQCARLFGARRVIAPCRFTSSLYRRHYPNLDMLVAYHPDWERNVPYPPVSVPEATKGGTLRVLVMGAINREKGADVLEAVARLSRERGAPIEFLLLGYAYRALSGPIQDLGPYAHNDVGKHLRRIKPHLVWFPAMVPETYSYALSEVLVCGMPIAACDIGAFAERLQDRPLTWIAPWQAGVEAWLDILVGVRDELIRRQGTEEVTGWTSQPDLGRRFYSDEYLQAIEQRSPGPERINPAWLRKAAEGGILDSYTLSFKEQLLLTYTRVNASRVGRALIRAVPSWVREWMKRRL